MYDWRIQEIKELNRLYSHDKAELVAIHSTLITTFGLIQNEYSGAFSNVIVLDDLFKEE